MTEVVHATSGRTPAIVAVSTSLKVAHSASRALLELAIDRLSPVYPAVDYLDLAAHNVPLFAGENPSSNEAVAPLLERVRQCGGLLFSVPCYWSSFSGVFKNFIDVLTGPAYDLRDSVTVFSGKPVALIVVGADQASAIDGRADAERVLRAVGADVLSDAVVVAEPRTVPLAASVPGDVARLAGILARTIVSRSRSGSDA